MMDVESWQGPLRDIHGIDPVSWWPPAPGWWALTASVAVMLLLLPRLARSRPAWPAVAGVLMARLMRRPWQSEALCALARLRQDVGQRPPVEIASALSALLRRIAIARCGRESCAGLQDRAWLDWLSAQDPVGFDWHTEGHWLVRAPYAPASAGAADDHAAAALRRLIGAAEVWARAPLPRRSSKPRPALRIPLIMWLAGQRRD